MEFELDGEDVLDWLTQVGPAEGRYVLVGCLLDDSVNENLLKIQDIGSNFTLECELDGTCKQITHAQLRRSTVIDTRSPLPLQAAVYSESLPQIQERLEAQNILRCNDIPPKLLTRSADLHLLASVLISIEKNRLPQANSKDKFLDAMKRANCLAQADKIFRKWLKLHKENSSVYDSDLIIKLVYCRRHSGRLKKALNATNCVVKHYKDVNLSERQRAVLATMRAAILMDLFEIRRDWQLLSEARKCANIAWAISNSNETSLLYSRLQALESRTVRLSPESRKK
jgi:hypothetical protein